VAKVRRTEPEVALLIAWNMVGKREMMERRGGRRE
jgi:hypothetical protein